MKIKVVVYSDGLLEWCL